MKQIYTLLAATLMMAGTTLWSGCSNNELLENEKPDIENTDNQQVAAFRFSLKGMMKPNTRAVAEDLTKEGEKVVKTLYVALFVKDGGTEKEDDYQLHRIFAYDDEATGEAWQEYKITRPEDGTDAYIIEKPGTVGDYVAYFIANPDDDMKAEFAKFQLSGGTGAELGTRTKLSDLEALKAKKGTADGTVLVGAAGSQTARGFIMIAKQDITLSTDATTLQDINLTRLAARFDFINSAATESDSKVTITGITMKSAAQTSRLMEVAEVNSNETFEEQAVTLDSWTNQTVYLSAYTYENLNLTDANASKRLSITIEYTLKKGSGAGESETKMSKDILLKVGESDLAVQRNHIYRIYMNGVTGDFNIEVKDWNEGETVTVPDGNLDIKYTEKDLGKIGDYVYLKDGALDFSDGGLRKASLNGQLTWAETMPNKDPDKGDCIGIVFSNNMTANDKAKGWTGYAVAPKRVVVKNDKIAWAINDEYAANDPAITDYSVIKAIVNDRDGYSYCKSLEEKGLDNYPVLKTVKTLQPAIPDDITSGWYVPSIGLICDMFYNLDGLYSLHSSYQNVDISRSKNNNKLVYQAFKRNNKINDFTQRAAGEDISVVPDDICTCSEIEKTDGIYINIDQDDFRICGYMDKTDSRYVSFAVFAFTYPSKP
ncbi:hypothetical protein AAE250_18470 [Bacteroides sp. GD17]|uniref:hypothetical protein n=1 Tax=Bacteroides sp. GD17 TaxID=3139826 RepID=UPI00313C9E8A